MAVEFVAFTESSHGAAGSITLTKPTGTAEGDRLVAIIAANSSSETYTAPAGFTLLGTLSSVMKISVWEKEAGASEGASYSWSRANNQIGRAGLFAVRGHDPSLESAVSLALDSDPASSSSPSVDMAVADGLAISFGSTGDGGSWTPPGAITKVNSGGGYGAGYAEGVAAGATGAYVWTVSGHSNVRSILATVAVSPEGGGALVGWGIPMGIA